MSNKTKEVKPPKTLIKSMLEAAANRKEKELPKNVIKAAKKIARMSSTRPGHSAFPDPMPTSILMNKINRGKIQKSLGKSVRTGSDKPKKLDSGGLIGNQKKLDMDNSGSLTKKDFKILRNKPTVNKKLGGSIQVSGNNFSGVY